MTIQHGDGSLVSTAPPPVHRPSPALRTARRTSHRPPAQGVWVHGTGEVDGRRSVRAFGSAQVVQADRRPDARRRLVRQEAATLLGPTARHRGHHPGRARALHPVDQVSRRAGQSRRVDPPRPAARLACGASQRDDRPGLGPVAPERRWREPALRRAHRLGPAPPCLRRSEPRVLVPSQPGQPPAPRPARTRTHPKAGDRAPPRPRRSPRRPPLRIPTGPRRRAGRRTRSRRCPA